MEERQRTKINLGRDGEGEKRFNHYITYTKGSSPRQDNDNTTYHDLFMAYGKPLLCHPDPTTWDRGSPLSHLEESIHRV